MRDGAELVSEEFFPLFRGVVQSLINERGGAGDGINNGISVESLESQSSHSTPKQEEAFRPTRRLSGRQRLVITR